MATKPDKKPAAKLSVIERRLANASPFEGGSVEIPQKQPGKWKFRIVNAKAATNRIWEMIKRKGWEFAVPDDLAEDPGDLGFDIRDGRLVQGERGSEVLMKMLSSDFKKVEQAKTKYNVQHTFGAKHVKSAIVEGAGTTHGSEAADFLNRSLHHVDVIDTRVDEGAEPA